MKKIELINQLSGYSDDEEIFFASDEEGNQIFKDVSISNALCGYDKNDNEIIKVIIYPNGKDVDVVVR